MATPASPAETPARRSWWPALLIVLAVILAHGNTLEAPFVFDDIVAVSTNTTIRQFDTALQPPRDGSTTMGRPLLNLTYAVNYALGGLRVRDYHVGNLLIHAAAALTLFGLLRRTLSGPVPPASIQAQAGPLALAIALLWAMHPLQTETVVSVAQRTESLCGLFYLLTLWCFVRGAAGRPRLWLSLSLAASFAGMASKEVMATAPLLVLLYDRTFVSRSFAAAWQRHRAYYAGLAASWLLLGWLAFAGGGTRGASAGLGLGISWWSYLLTQCDALLLYLKLSFWPHPLVVDRGVDVVSSWTDVWWQGLVVLALLGSTLWALVRRPAWGFLGAWFFVILAPSSSFIPLVSQTIAEHRMYLPLAAVLAVAIIALFNWLTPRMGFAVTAVAIVAAGIGTHRHNQLYLDEQALWEDVLRYYPQNARVLSNLGRVHFREGRVEESLRLYQESMRLDPRNPHSRYNAGLALLETGRLEEAAAAFNEALRLKPDYYGFAHYNLAVTLLRLGRPAEALLHLAEAIRLEPGRPEMIFEQGVALERLGRLAEAGECYAQTLRINPDYAEARSNWGVVLFRQQAVDQAIEQFRLVLQLDPSLAQVHYNLAQALAAKGNAADSLKHYAEAVRLDPKHPEARLNLGIALGMAGRLPEALAQLTEAARLRPDSAQVHANLAVALADSGRPAEALPHYEKAAELTPNDPQAHCNLAYALLVARRPAEARTHLETALRLQPDFAPARALLREAFGITQP